MDERQMLGEIGPIERHVAEEPQCRNGGVYLGRIGAARGKMQPKAPHLLRARRAGRAAQECRELLDPLHIVMLGFGRELADRHVVDPAPAQRADDLLGHWSAPVLSEVRTPRSQGRTRCSARMSDLMMSGLKLA